MKKYIIFIILILSYFSVFSQTPNKKNTFLFEPSSFLNFVNPAFEIGYERELNKKNSIKANVGIVTPRSLGGFLFIAFFDGKNADYSTFSGYKFNLEYKHWRRKNFSWSNKSMFSQFIAVDVFYNKKKRMTRDNFLVVDSNFNYPSDIEFLGGTYYEDFIVNTTKIGIDIKTGYQKVYRDWVTTISYGVGIQRRYATHSNRINMNDILFDETLVPFFPFPRCIVINREGNEWVISMPFNFIVGYRF